MTPAYSFCLPLCCHCYAPETLATFQVLLHIYLCISFSRTFIHITTSAGKYLHPCLAWLCPSLCWSDLKHNLLREAFSDYLNKEGPLLSFSKILSPIFACLLIQCANTHLFTYFLSPLLKCAIYKAKDCLVYLSEYI